MNKKDLSFEHNPKMHKKSHLAKNASLIGFGTAVSRILGFVRDIIIAHFFGTGFVTQAFVVAWRIPNMLRDLVGEGAANAAIVPVLSSYKQKGKQEYLEAVGVLFNAFFFVLIALTFLGVCFAPWIVRLLAPGMIHNVEFIEQTVVFTRLLFPYLILIGFTAFAMGVLNSLHHFLVPAFSQACFNSVWIISVVILSRNMTHSVMPLVIGVLIGGVVQFGINVPVLYSYGVRLQRTINFSHDVVKKVVSLLLPRIAGTGVYQLSVIISTAFASLSFIVGEGSLAAIYFASRLIQLPLAVFGVSLAQAALPTLSELVIKKDMKKFKDTIAFSLRTTFFVTIPASVGLFMLAHPIVATLFERGKFDAYSTKITVSALAWYCLGLFALGGIKIFVSAFFSLNDTKTPVKVAFCSLLLNTLLAGILIWPMKIAGIALATSIAAIFNFGLLGFYLKKRIGDFQLVSVQTCFIKMTIAALVMGLGLVLMNIWIAQTMIMKSMYVKFLILMLEIVCGCIFYVVACYIFRVKEIENVRKWILKKK